MTALTTPPGHHAGASFLTLPAWTVAGICNSRPAPELAINAGIGQQPIVITLATAIDQPDTTGDHTRVSDDMPVGWWDDIQGRHIEPPPVQPSRQALADAAVRNALTRMQDRSQGPR